jgi:hypothetical protein
VYCVCACEFPFSVALASLVHSRWLARWLYMLTQSCLWTKEEEKYLKNVDVRKFHMFCE